jgi:hypothetical protein
MGTFWSGGGVYHKVETGICQGLQADIFDLNILCSKSLRPSTPDPRDRPTESEFCSREGGSVTRKKGTESIKRFADVDALSKVSSNGKDTIAF